MINFLRILLVVICGLGGYFQGFSGFGIENESIWGLIIGLSAAIVVVLLDIFFKKVTVKNILSKLRQSPCCPVGKRHVRKIVQDVFGKRKNQNQPYKKNEQ